jgi:catechol 2,3-dioxygenase-like lactoylglutathione lyase family enzyme
MNTTVMAFIATTDMDRAKAFYGGVLGLPLVAEDAFALMFDAGGAPLRVTRVDAASVASYTALGWVVPDIARAIRDLGGRGVAFLRFDHIEQDELGVWTAPGSAKVAWFKDPEGHVLSLTQE